MAVTEVDSEKRSQTWNGGSKVSASEKFLTFKLGEESYGIAVLQIREIIRIQKITPVPQMPPYIRGVINLRGKVIPVLDMRTRFGVGCGELSERTCIVVVQVEAGGQTSNIGLVVDAVEEVLNIPAADIEETPDMGGSLDNDFITGIAKVRGEVKTLLKVDRVVLEHAEKLVR